MDWIKLLSTHKLGGPQEELGTDGLRDAFTRDYDRVIFSSAFRRLQDKTQVFPLAKSDYVRTRLTHSLEVASVGRSLGMLAADVILRREPALERHFVPQDVGTVVATACLVHDIGNPPFGHSGESAMQEWFAQQELPQELTPAQRLDFLRFEGNAQGFRTLCSLHNAPQPGGMRLSAAILGTFTKYPCAADAAGQGSGISAKKFGFMQSEACAFEELAHVLGLVRKPGAAAAWQRHPLAFLVEAADDVCYHVIDAEDGFKTGCLSFEEVCELHRPWLKPEQWARAHAIQDPARCVEYLRSVTMDTMAHAMAHAFEANYDAIMEGRFDQELASQLPLQDEFRAFTALERRKVYTARPVVEVLACGAEVISGLLETFVEALEVEAGQRRGGAWRARTLRRLMPGALVPAQELNAYARLLQATDFVSGMTDSFALALFQRIRGISLA
jgi:dGTPase